MAETNHLTSHARVLCVDDDEDSCAMLAEWLSAEGYRADYTVSPTEALELVSRNDFDAVISDLSMKELDGLALCRRLLERRPALPVVVVTGKASMEAAIGAIRVGAYDFLTKPIEPKLLTISVARAIRTQRLQAEVTRLRSALSDAPSSTRVLGDSGAIRQLNDLIRRVAPSDASVLIVGETGTGKELVARSIHESSGRGAFVPVNCAAVPPALLESELFGHTRGAFTDARGNRKGLFVEAEGGTLFLDEIGEMPQEMQAKLLRALQEKRVRPVGSNAEVPFDARIISATHRDLDEAVGEGAFRQDLYYRINVVTIPVPPLRERGSDALKLAAHFLQAAAERTDRPALRLSPEVAERLLAYDWPGNVRELENCMERAVALARFDQLAVDDLPARIRNHRPDGFTMTADEVADIIPLEELERRYIARALKVLNGNKARVAQKLGMDRRTLYRRLEKYDRSESNDAS